MKILMKFLGMMAMILVLGLLLAWPASILWNECLVPAIVVVREVGVYQMWGINILASIMIKGIEVSTK